MVGLERKHKLVFVHMAMHNNTFAEIRTCSDWQFACHLAFK